MTRTRPRRWRNCYRDRTWLAAVHRQWRIAAGLPDLDSMFNDMMRELDVADIQIEITLKGRERRLILPVLSPGNIESAVGRMAWWRQTGAADQRILDAADRVLDAISRVGI